MNEAEEVEIDETEIDEEIPNQAVIQAWWDNA